MLIKYIKSIVWRVANCLSYTEEARCLNFKREKIWSIDNVMVVCFGKMVVRVQGIFCKKMLRIRKNAAKMVAMSELDRKCSVSRF